MEEQVREMRRLADEQFGETMHGLNRTVEEAPSGLAGTTRDNLERLKTLRHSFAEQKAEIARQAARCDELRGEVATRGAPCKLITS